MTAALETFARRVLGSYTDEGTHQPDGRRRVLHLTDSQGKQWYCKQTRFVVQWRAEVRAYRRWFSDLDEEVARLRAANRDKQLLLISGLPGEVVPEPTPDVHRAAGALLRRLHDAGPARREPPAKRRQMSVRLEREAWLEGGDFDAAEAAFIRARMNELRELPLLDEVGCHGDYGPHNWLVDDAGTVRVIDFAESKWNPPAFDLARLCLQSWWDKPRHSAAFFAGYGRQLSDLEHEYLRLQVVRSAVAAVQWGRQHGEQHVEDRARSRLADMMDGFVLDIRDVPGARGAVRTVARRVRALR